MPSKNNLRDKLEDDVLDLSLMQFTEVPVEDIAELPKGTTLDLSNNLLTYLPDTFPTLIHIVKLDLSKNQIEELPEYFGQLRNLCHLDLYSNKLGKLPVSFASLKSLKWLDLKNNPLVPALQQAAGPCITASDCAMCAKKVVALMQSMQSQLERERQRHILEDQRAKEELRQAEEQERERLRAEKRAAKERRRDEARAREEVRRRESEAVLSAVQHEMEQPRASGNNRNGMLNGNSTHHNGNTEGRGWCWSLFMILAGIAVVIFGSGVSILWIYTGGHLDQRSIERALPIIQRDIDSSLLNLGLKTEAFFNEANKKMGPYLSSAGTKAEALWVELKRRNDLVAHYINENLGPYFCQAKKSAFDLWAQSRPYFQQLGQSVIHLWKEVYSFGERFLPPLLDYVYGQLVAVTAWAQKTLQSVMS